MKTLKFIKLSNLRRRFDSYFYRISLDGISLARFHARVANKWLALYYRASVKSSDLAIIRQVFVRRDYSFGRGAHAAAMNNYLKGQSGQPLIIDAGGNIGASAVYLLTIFPKAFAYVIEPEGSNCKILSHNLRAFSNSKLFQGAIGGQSGSMFLKRGSDCGHRVQAEGSEAVQVIDPASILSEMMPLKRYPFILKIDIEGGEENLFAGDTSWLDLFPCVIIEMHDWMLPFSGSSRNFQRAIANLDFDLVQRGENLFCFNRRKLKDYML